MIKSDKVRIGNVLHTRFYCPVEGCRTFKYSFEDLKEHVRTVHDETEAFECDKCNRSFTSLRRLVKHKCPYASRHLKPFYEKEQKQTYLVEF